MDLFCIQNHRHNHVGTDAHNIATAIKDCLLSQCRFQRVLDHAAAAVSERIAPAASHTGRCGRPQLHRPRRQGDSRTVTASYVCLLAEGHESARHDVVGSHRPWDTGSLVGRGTISPISKSARHPPSHSIMYSTYICLPTLTCAVPHRIAFQKVCTRDGCRLSVLAQSRQI